MDVHAPLMRACIWRVRTVDARAPFKFKNFPARPFSTYVVNELDGLVLGSDSQTLWLGLLYKKTHPEN